MIIKHDVDKVEFRELAEFVAEEETSGIYLVTKGRYGLLPTTISSEKAVDLLNSNSKVTAIGRESILTNFKHENESEKISMNKCERYY